MRLGIEGDALSDDARIAAESALPELMAQQHDVVLAVGLFLRQKVAPENRLEPQQ